MRWTLKTAPNLFLVDQLSEELSIDRVLSSLLVQRGVHTFEQAKKFLICSPFSILPLGKSHFPPLKINKNS